MEVELVSRPIAPCSGEQKQRRGEGFAGIGVYGQCRIEDEKAVEEETKKIEVFETTQTKKDDEPGEVVWCDERLKKTAVQYSILEKELMVWLFAEA